MLSASLAGTVTMAMSTRSLRQNSSSSCTPRTRSASPGPVARADHRGRAVEDPHQPKAFLAEGPVAGQGPAELTGPDDDHVPLLVQPQAAGQLADEVLDLVAHAAHAELAEVAEVLAYLRGVGIQALGQLL